MKCNSRSLFNRSLSVIIAFILAMSIINISFLPVQTVQAAEILETDVSEPSDGCLLLGFSGRFYSDAQAALDRINAIRYEACTDGNVPDPRDNTRMLSEEDYIPIKWSTDLERIARIRAYESALVMNHARLNGKDVFMNFNGVTNYGGESLAWNYSTTMVSGINQWYEEKAYWLDLDLTEETGHYTSMINPNNTYVGLADFYSSEVKYPNTICGEYNNAYTSGLDETMAAATGDIIQKVDIKTNYITEYSINENCEIAAGETVDTDLYANVSISTLFEFTNSLTMPVLGGATFASSEPDVATVSDDGTVTAVAAGTATISALVSGSTVASFTVTVTGGDSGIIDSGSNGTTSWVLDSTGLLTISGTGSTDNTRPWYSYKDQITAVVIEDGITNIRSSAFYGCTNLTEVSIADSVTEIQMCAFANCSALGAVTLPANLVTLGAEAFTNCSGLTSIIIPASVTTMKEGVFQYCTGLEEVVVDEANSVYDSRDNCNAIIETATNTLIFGCKNTVIPGSITTIGANSFMGCEFETITIPENVTEIGQFAFDFCKSLKSITIPSKVESIEIYTFWGDTALESVTIPSSVTSIGDYAFGNCTALTDVYYEGTEDEWNTITIGTTNDCLTAAEKHYGCGDDNIVASGTCGDNLTWILDSDGLLVISGEGEMEDYSSGDSPFCLNENIKTIKIEDGITTIGDYVFQNCSSLTNITIPNSVTSIGNYAFSWCSSLTDITIPDSVTSIGEWAFYDCNSLTSITIPASVASIGQYAFGQDPFVENVSLTSIIVSDGNTTFDSRNNCNAIIETATNTLILGCANTIIPESVTSIGRGAFYGCSSLTSITIPDSVTSIGEGAFMYCRGLTSITIPASVTSIGSHAFYGCRLTGITIPDSVTSIGSFAFWGCSFTSLTIPASVTSIGDRAFCSYDSLTSIIVDGGNTTFDSRDDCNAIIETDTNTLILGCVNTVIPTSVTNIGASAFYFCGLTSIIIPDSVTNIGDRAFSGCRGLTDITIPDSVTSIGDSSFANCVGLTNITLPDSVTSIGNSAFDACDSLTSITLPNSVVSIGERAFAMCDSLTSITIPASLTSIGNAAFSHCSNLTDVYYKGTEDDWAAISIGDYNQYLTNAVIHFIGNDDAVKCLGHTITLNESISLNYYFELPDTLVSDSGAKLIFYKNGENVSELLLSDAGIAEKDGVTGYMFSLPLVTKEMADSVEAVIVDSDGNESEHFEYSAKEYCEELIQQSAEDAELVTLVKSLMNYGAAAQSYFSYNTDNMVNSSLSDEDKVIGTIADGALSEYVTTCDFETDYSNDISYYGYSLDLLADLNIKLYFSVPDGKTIDDYQFTVTDNADNSVTMETGYGSYGPYARISNIYSVDIDAEYVVDIYYNNEHVGSIRVSPFAYINSSLENDDLNENLRTLLYAMYYYNSYADRYFN